MTDPVDAPTDKMRPVEYQVVFTLLHLVLVVQPVVRVLIDDVFTSGLAQVTGNRVIYLALLCLGTARRRGEDIGFARSQYGGGWDNQRE